MIVFLGQSLLALIVGDAFIGAYVILTFLVFAKTVSVFGFPLTPAMYAMGRPGLLLRINVVLTLLYLPLLYGMLDVYGRNGAGVARIAFSVAAVVLTAIVVKLAIDGRLKPFPSQ